jgi:hypothetical protein
LKENPLKRSDLDDFVACWFGCSGAVSASKSGESAVTDRRYSGNRHERKESERFKSFTYEKLLDIGDVLGESRRGQSQGWSELTIDSMGTGWSVRGNESTIAY